MSTIACLRSGVDWLAMTIGTDEAYNVQWRLNATRRLELMADSGYTIKPRAMLGYIGVAASNCFVGGRDDGWLVQFTGFHADEAFDETWHPKANISRLDLQVTVTYDEMPLTIIDDAYEQSTSANSELPKERRRKIWKIVGDNGGETLYLGSWKSEQYGYIYNKEVESEDPLFTKSWRYEIRLKNDIARQAYQKLCLPHDERHQMIALLVAGWFAKRGVTVPWTVSDVGDILPIVKTQPSDIERSLWWLERQVRPVVQRLVDAGFMDQVSQALGILL